MVAARFGKVDTTKLPDILQLPMTGYEEADRNWLLPVTALTSQLHASVAIVQNCRPVMG
jgi:hypothetical protein